MNRYLIGVLLALSVAGAWLLARSRGAGSANAPSPERADVASESASGVTLPPARPATAPPFERVVRLTPEQHHELVARIAAARARRTAAAAAPALPTEGALGGGTPAPALPATMATPQQVLEELQANLGEVKEYVAECVAKYGANVKRFKANLTLTGDPDIGSLIDATGLVGPDGAPVPAQLDDCVRSQLQTLALPPIKSGDGFSVSYDFEL